MPLDAAHDTPRALEAAFHATRAAEGMYAYTEALSHLERVLSLWAQVPDAEARTGMRHVDLMRYTALQADMSGNVDRALGFVQAALRDLDAGEDPITAGLLHDRWGRCACASPAHDEVLGHCRDRGYSFVPDDRARHGPTSWPRWAST